MIQMHHIIANLELLKLLQRQRHLACTCLLGAQVVLVVTVEYLMVGKETSFQVIIHETSMNSFVNSCEMNVCPLFLEDALQSVCLFLAVCQNIELVAIFHILLKRLEQHLKVLMENGLRVGFKGN